MKKILLLLILISCSTTKNENTLKNQSLKYDDLVLFFNDWRNFENPPLLDGAPDYTRERFDKDQSKFLELVENNVKVVFLGDIQPIERDIILQMRKLEKATRNNDGLTLNIALNYSGRNEIIRVTKKIASDCKSENLKIEDINDNLFQK